MRVSAEAAWAAGWQVQRQPVLLGVAGHVQVLLECKQVLSSCLVRTVCNY